MLELKCNSCKIDLTNQQNSTRFACPNCGKSEIIRCGKCRSLATQYECPNCGFTGPN